MRLLRWLCRKTEHRYVNGGKGVISILLALLMIPFTIQADMLLESTRYHASSTALDEIMDSAATSTLAHYDRFLMERFGLTAIGQEKKLQTIYKNYFNENLAGAHIAWNNRKLTVNGRYPLSETAVLENEILELSKYSVPTEMASGMLVDVVKYFLGKFDSLDAFTNIASALSGSADAVGAMADAVTTFENLEDETKKATELKSTYDGKFEAFKGKVSELAEAHRDLDQKQAEKDAADNEKDAAVLEYSDITSQIDNYVPQSDSDSDTGSITEETDIQSNDTETSSVQTDSYLEELKKQQEEAEKRVTEAEKKSTKTETALQNAKNRISSKESELRTAIQEYMSSISDLKVSLTNCKNYTEDAVDKVGTAASSCTNAAKDIGNAFVKWDTPENKKRNKELDGEIEELQVQIKETEDSEKREKLQKQIDDKKALSDECKSMLQTAGDNSAIMSNVANGVDNRTKAATKALEESLKGYDKNTIDGCIEALDVVYGNVSGFSVETVTSSTVLKDIDYYVSHIAGLAPLDQITSALTDLNNQFTDKEDGESIGFWSFCKGMGSLMDGLFNINLFYDGRLDAVIDVDEMGNGLIDELVISLADVASDMSDLQSFWFKISPLSLKLKKMYKLAVDVSKAVTCTFFYVRQMITGLAAAVSQLFDGAYDKAVLAEFMNRSCANRTTFEGSDILTGYSFQEAGLGTSKDPLNEIMGVNVLTSLMDTIKNYREGNADTFCGAEAEYLLMGSRSELVNQTMTFFDLYIIRLILDIIPVLTNSEVQAIEESVGAVSFGIGGFVVLIIYLLLEPFVDTLVLVNGAKIDVWKKCCYLTPTGIPTLIGRLTSIKLTSAEKDKMMKDYASAIHQEYSTDMKATSDDDSIIRFDYSSYLFAFLLFQDKNLTLSRFQNIINLEARKKNANFEIGKAYTYLSAESEGEYKPFLSAASLYTNLVFSGKKKQVRGY